MLGIITSLLAAAFLGGVAQVRTQAVQLRAQAIELRKPGAVHPGRQEILDVLMVVLINCKDALLRQTLSFCDLFIHSAFPQVAILP